MKFHPLYERRFAMGLRDLNEASPGIIATQSAHKQLASFSQASQIHMRDRHIKGQRRRVEHRRFNEGFMQFASTSPFYPLFASLDVGAQMMKGRSGEVLWDDAIRLGIELRKKLRAVRREFEEKERDPARRWFFDPVRAAARLDPGRCARERGSRCALGKRVDRPARARPAILGARAGRGLAWLSGARGGFRDHRSGQAHPAHAGLRPRDRRLRGPWRSGPGRRSISAREPGGVGEERPQLAPLFVDARRRVRARRARWCRRWSPSSGCTTTTSCSRTPCRNSSPSGRRAIVANGCKDLCGEMHAFFREFGVSNCRWRNSPPSICRTQP